MARKKQDGAAKTKPKPKEAKVPKFYRECAEELAKNGALVPGQESPVCRRCKLDMCGSKTPYMEYAKAERADILLVLDAPSKKEDFAGEKGLDGPTSFIAKVGTISSDGRMKTNL